MTKKHFELNHKEKKPVLAICYDFDKTLSPDDMQAQGYIQSVGYDVADFWKESNGLAESNDMDQNLAYMYMMKEKAHGQVLFTKAALMKYGSNVRLFPGVDSWFDRIREYGEEQGVIVEHYIISSGLKEMIEGTAVAKSGAFKKIYASSFYYDSCGVAQWPAQVVNYTNKTQFLFRIEKGVLDVNDFGVNDYFNPEELRIPFRNMVYIGDSDTDIPCMKLVNSRGGHSVGVYNPSTADKSKVYKMMRDGRIKYYVPSDYSEGSLLDQLIKKIICKTAASESLEDVYYACKKENVDADKLNNEEERHKSDLICALECSRSFARTHSVIGDMQKYSDWQQEDRELLYEIALSNSQVRYILGDLDLKSFYRRLLQNEKCLSERAQKISELLLPDDQESPENSV